MDDTSLDDANTARDTAVEQQGIAAEHLTTAMMEQTDAETAEMKATMYADSHVVGLLRMANASHITTASDVDARTDITEVGLIERNRLDHVSNVNDAVEMANLDSEDPSHGGAAVEAHIRIPRTKIIPTRMKTPNVPVNPSSNSRVAPRPRSCTLSRAQTAKPELTTTSRPTSWLGPGLGDFPHEKYITGRDADGENTGTRVILFTDIKQANAPSDAITASVVNVNGGE